MTLWWACFLLLLLKLEWWDIRVWIWLSLSFFHRRDPFLFLLHLRDVSNPLCFWHLFRASLWLLLIFTLFLPVSKSLDNIIDITWIHPFECLAPQFDIRAHLRKPSTLSFEGNSLVWIVLVCQLGHLSLLHYLLYIGLRCYDNWASNWTGPHCVKFPVWFLNLLFMLLLIQCQLVLKKLLRIT